MAAALHPSAALHGGKLLPQLPACEHYCGSVKLLDKSLSLRERLGPVFDITADCEDGAPIGEESEHARRLAQRIAAVTQPEFRIGARIHDIRHPLWEKELDLFLGISGDKLAYLVLPKAEGLSDVCRMRDAVETLRQRYGIARPIPLHVLIETPAALHEVWPIAALPEVETLDFGLMDFVSAHHGAIPEQAMRSPAQFSHPLIKRAKCEIAAAALAHGKVPAHNVTTEIRDLSVVSADARCARLEFGFLRMWSIHPDQILPIVEAMRPPLSEVEQAAKILIAAQDADWGPIQIDGRLHDRASYRYHWELLLDARRTGLPLPRQAEQRFFHRPP